MVASCYALMGKYDFTNYFMFSQHLPQDQREQFQDLITEGQEIVKASLQASLSITVTALPSVATTIVHALSILAAILQPSLGNTKRLWRTFPLRG